MLDLSNMTKIPEISVFLPTYNEGGSIANVVQKTAGVLNKIAQKWELAIVNDGSTDSTSDVVKKQSAQDARIKLKNHEKNRGYGAALKTGFYTAKYKWIAFIDSDGQFDFAEITKFLEVQKDTGADLVIGYYKKRQVSKFKIVTSRLWELSVFLLFGLKVHDIDCGFKLISKDVFKKIAKLESERGAFISSELLIKAKKAGFKIVEVPVTHYPRRKGVGTGRNLNVIIKSFVDLFRLWKKLR
jgi:glycosyltransferase involved in cell wall biosynthesis